MKVLILAAGYGTRLYPLIKDTPKPLLVVGNKPIIDHLLKKIERLPDLKEVIVVTNKKFFNLFEDWAQQYKTWKVRIGIINDGTLTPEERLGAMGDVHFVLQEKEINDDLLILGGDNLFDYPLDDFLAFARGKTPHAVIGLYDVKDKKKARNFGVVKLDAESKVISFEEKPQSPQSTLVGMCLYYLSKNSLAGVEDYFKSSKKLDTTGDFIQWLAGQKNVYGFTFQGRWYDIGSIESYKMAQEQFA